MQLGEVAVVAGGLDRRAEGRVHEAFRLPGREQGDGEHVCEGRRDRDDGGRGPVHAVELAVRAKAAERQVALGEEPLDLAPLAGARAADEDVATHRDEAVHAHDPPVDSCGVDCEGATKPESP
jgi:hypothetical protein